MKLRNITVVLLVAGVTAALTLIVAGAWRAGIAEAGTAVKPVIPRPQITSQGCTFVLKADKAAYEEGETPVIEVTATNPTDKPVDASVWVIVSSTSPLSARSRMLPIPTALWSGEYAFSLKPGETKMKSVTCGAALPAGQSVRIVLSDKKDAVLGLETGIPGDLPKGGPNQGQDVRNKK